MATVLLVRMVNGELEVEDLELERPSPGEDITWKLDDETLPGATFAQPPMQWIRKAPWNVISWPPDVSSDRRQMTVEDDHRGSGTVGLFIYQLNVERVNANGTRERFTSTKTTDLRTADGRLTSNNPVIINR